MILTCKHGHEWISEDEDDEEPCPTCYADEMEVRKQEWLDAKAEQRYQEQDLEDARTLGYWERLIGRTEAMEER